MGLEVIALASLAMGAVSAYNAYDQRQEAASQMRKSAREQKKIQSEQKALQYQQQAQERRQQIREERVRRAMLLQASENSGTVGSSGESGGLSSMASQLTNNLGINAGRAAAGDRMSIFAQNAANFNLGAQQAMHNAQNADAMFGLSMNIFSASGGVNSASSVFGSSPSTPAVQPLNTESPVNVGDAYWKS
jgi:hypothetical protein